MTAHSKTIAVLAGFVLALLVFAAFVLFPLLRSIRADSAKVFVARQELSQVSMYEEHIRKFEELSKARENEIALFDDLFVDRKTPIAFIEFLETYSQGSEVSLEISPVESLKKEADVWDSIDFDLTGKGTFPNVMSFMEQVENAPYLLEFKNLTLQRLATGEASFLFLIKVYTK
ncbi:MAG: hypothetical protein HYU04_00610 [Candidatus Wildermuthbacteria bacterium]|nr:hypothetical protein [Candidatus Wildermuthbacteria bacterium]